MRSSLSAIAVEQAIGQGIDDFLKLGEHFGVQYDDEQLHRAVRELVQSKRVRGTGVGTYRWHLVLDTRPNPSADGGA